MWIVLVWMADCCVEVFFHHVVFVEVLRFWGVAVVPVLYVHVPYPGGVKCCSTETTVYRMYTYRTPGAVECCSTETTLYHMYTFHSTQGPVKCCSTETTVNRMYKYHIPRAVKCCRTETTVSQCKYWPTLHSTTVWRTPGWRVVLYCILDCTVDQ